MINAEVEICVLGGGPAGSIIAHRLAALGHRPILLERDAPTQPHKVESFSFSILTILNSLGLSDAVATATIRRERRALVRWQSDLTRPKFFESASLLIDRPLFDQKLRQAAAGAGAAVLRPASARAPQHHPSGRWLIPVTTTFGPMSILANFLVDARGKRWSTSSCHDGPRTVAMSATWYVPHSTYVETRTEAGADKWFWGCPLDNDLYSATIFVDATRVAGLSCSERHDFYCELLGQSHLLRNLRRGELITPIFVRDATSRIAKDLIEKDFLRVGEAAFSMDPLSSQGVQRAIVSGLQGGAAVHTILTKGDYDGPIKFYRERQQNAAKQATLNAMRLYRDHVHSKKPFWIARLGPLQTSSAPPKATQRLPSISPALVRLSEELELVHVPVLCRDSIQQTTALSHPRLQEPIAYLNGIALAPLVCELAQWATADQVLKSWTEQMPRETAQYLLASMCLLGLLESSSPKVCAEATFDNGSIPRD
jgi:flavin-dependent dehydrogenase